MLTEDEAKALYAVPMSNDAIGSFVNDSDALKKTLVFHWGFDSPIKRAKARVHTIIILVLK